MPDGEHLCGPRHVIIASAEDDPGDTIRPRLEVAGADLDLVHIVELDGPDLMSLPQDVPALREAIEQYDVGLVIIDPLLHFLSDEVDSYKDQKVRRALYPLSRMAADTGCAVLCIRHFTKGGSGRAIHRGGGSVGFIALARLGWVVGEDPSDPSRRLLAVSKCNIAAQAPTLAYQLVPYGGVVRIEWLGPVDTTADQMVTIQPRENEERATALSAAKAFLVELLSDGDLWVKDVKDNAKDAGFSWSTVRRAKDDLKVAALKIGKPKDEVQGWQWHLPQGAQKNPKVPNKKHEHLRENLGIFGEDVPEAETSDEPGLLRMALARYEAGQDLSESERAALLAAGIDPDEDPDAF